MGRAPVAIIGVGNFLMGDEGVGIHAVERLRRMYRPEGVEIIDGGTPGFSLLHMIEGRRIVIIIDCADFGGKPGEVAVFDPDELTREERREVSLHTIDLLSALDLARRTGRYPAKVRIIGIQPDKIEMGTKLSAAAEGSLNELLEIITEKTRIL